MQRKGKNRKGKIDILTKKEYDENRIKVTVEG